jgi:inorganic pyrophosphatase
LLSHGFSPLVSGADDIRSAGWGSIFDVYKELERKKTAVEGWEDAGSAKRVIRLARGQFKG